MADFTKMASREIQKEVDAALKVFDKLGEQFTVNEQRKLLRPAAKVLMLEIANNAPRSEQAHHQYATAKFNAGTRAPKGMGEKVATYYPGNLARSIKVLTFRRSAGVFVGPKFAKRNKNGDFKGKNVDGFYARFIEFGTKNFPARPFIRPAVATSRSAIVASIRQSTKRTLKRFERKHKK